MVKNKGLAILSYITLIGWIIALVLNFQKKDQFVSFHVRQYLMIMITGIVLMFVAGLLSFIPFIVLIAQIALLILWLMGLVSAIQGNKSEVPIIGSYGQKWFKSL